MRYTNGQVRGWATLLVAGAVMAGARPAPAQQDRAVAEGARVYGDMCGRCHNPRSPLERTDRDWVVIANHMRVRGNLTGQQVRNVLAFLQATNGDPRTPSGPSAADVATQPDRPPSADPEVIARGRTLVVESACLGCHVVGTEGGRVGPTLNGVARRRTAQYVRRKLADPAFDNATSMMPSFGLTAEQIEAIVAYLNTLGGK